MNGRVVGKHLLSGRQPERGFSVRLRELGEMTRGDNSLTLTSTGWGSSTQSGMEKAGGRGASAGAMKGEIGGMGAIESPPRQNL